MDLVLGAVTDLMFSVRIGDLAKRCGKRAVFAGTYDRMMAQAENHPVLVIVDLACAVVEPARLIRDLKGKGLRVIAFGAHVDVDSLRNAKEAGADAVMPRSKFVERLAELIEGAGVVASPPV